MFVKCLLLCLGVGLSAAWVVEIGPKYKPTEGEVWPKPQFEQKLSQYYSFVPWSFNTIVTGETCGILERAISRFGGITSRVHDVSIKYWVHGSTGRHKVSSDRYQGHLEGLHVQLAKPCEDYPYLYMDESYNLTVSKISKLESKSIWGILRGLETFLHLLYIKSHEVRINSTIIWDFPRYAHRGLLLDTSRHFISQKNILTTIDAMALNKFNVLHWHIVDDQSFPYQSERFPELSRAGAFHPSMVYEKDQIKGIAEYARDRGIRVVAEFDVPGHTRSWGAAYPDLLAKCYDESGKDIGYGPMDPLKNSTYKLLRELIEEVQEWFPDKYFHVGGDEVSLDCWESNPELKQYMEHHNMTSSMLHGLFMEKVIPFLTKTTPIVWQEVFDENVVLSKDTLVQVWKQQWTAEMIRVLRSGHKVLFSSSWYLDNLSDEFTNLYGADPRRLVFEATGEEELIKGIIGGEACMWGEMVDDSNVLTRVWPRASAVAERLWSPAAKSEDENKEEIAARHRLEEHACRMNIRGIPANPPNGPGFCLA